jgi:uncharacterized RDD family membrane protein YckC
MPMTDGVGDDERHASFGNRLIAELIDNLITFLPFFLLAETTGSAAASFFGTLAFAQLYNGVLDGTRGQTIGKRAVGIHVRDAGDTARTVGIARASTRAAVVTCIQLIGALVPFLGLLIVVDALACLWSERRQTWHDRIAGTVVLGGQWRPAPGAE